MSLEQVLLCPGAENPDETILVIGLLATAGFSAVRLPIFAGATTGLLRRARSGTPLCAVVIGVSLVVGVAAAIPLFGEVDEGWWRLVAALLALPGAPLMAGWLLTPWRKRGPRPARS